MKPRIQVDTLLSVLLGISTIVVYSFFPFIYPKDLGVENILVFLGVILIYKGNFLRMIARGHKKSYSQQSKSLVTTGVYSITRNPMYLGTFLIGVGFVCLAWPWWGILVFAYLFYLRFRRQIRKEETFLFENFNESYQKYCNQTPRFFPYVKNMLSIKIREVVNFKEAFSTKEKFGLISLPLIGFVLECVQRKIILGVVDVFEVSVLFVLAIVVYVVSFSIRYWMS